jgi:NAD(P)H-hydrate epimerase
MASGFEDSAPDELPACDAAVIGPGLGPAGDRDRPIFDLIKRSDVPTVIDADGLNAIAAGVLANRKLPDLSRCVVTPHPGEYDRLAEAVRLREDPRDPRARESAAYSLAGKLGCTVVLKGSGTVVSDGSTLWVCDNGHPCMATGGTGDVLAGVLGGLLAQNAAAGWQMSPFDLACAGVQAHAAAGEAWARANRANAGMLAEELADLIPSTLWPDASR